MTVDYTLGDPNCVPLEYPQAELIELGKGVYPVAYVRWELHCPPKWNTLEPGADGSALYDYWMIDCKDKSILHKVVRTIKPKLGIRDVRSLKLIQEGCCPKTLLIEMIGEEGIPD